MARRVRREPAAADRPGLGRARLQHVVATPEDPEGEHPLSRFGRRPAPADRQHGDQGRGRGRVERAQAWRYEAQGLAQDPHRDRRDGGGSGNGPVDRFPDDDWKSGPPSSPPATWGMPPCCPSCSTRSHSIKRSVASSRMAPSTPASAMTPSPLEGPPRSYPLARTPSLGSQTPRVLSHATRSCALRSASVGRSGDDGAVITTEAAQRLRCTVSNCSASARAHGTSTVRSQSSRSGLPCSTASPPSAPPVTEVAG